MVRKLSFLHRMFFIVSFIVLAICSDVFSEYKAPNYSDWGGGWKLGVTYFPISSPKLSNLRFSLFTHINKVESIPFGFEIDPVSIAIQEQKVSYFNLLFAPIAFIASYAFEMDDPFFNIPAMVIIAPQLIGNFRIYLLSFDNAYFLYAGETTDYYIYGKNTKVYTETNIGFKAIFGKMTSRIEISKPWLKAYSDKPNYCLSVTVGCYGIDFKKDPRHSK
ncbi:MAG: hypothetical protein ACOC10_10730 [Bacteroidota bacterium]